MEIDQIKVGTKVTISPEEMGHYTKEYLGWDDPMDRYIGKQAEVIEVFKGGEDPYVRLDLCINYNWDIRDLVPFPYRQKPIRMTGNKVLFDESEILGS